MGIEPTRPAWKAGILPLNYTRISTLYYYITFSPVCQALFRNFFKNFEVRWNIELVGSTNTLCSCIFPTSSRKNAWGKTLVFPQTPLALLTRITRLRREWSLRFSASGGLKPFSEEKGFWTLMSATTEKIVKATSRI